MQRAPGIRLRSRFIRGRSQLDPIDSKTAFRSTTRMKWVRLNRYCELSGETPDSFQNLRRKGLVAEGIHWKYDGLKRIWVNTEAMDRWVESSRPIAA